jgi:hypothetical protein
LARGSTDSELPRRAQRRDQRLDSGDAGSLRIVTPFAARAIWLLQEGDAM